LTTYKGFGKGDAMSKLTTCNGIQGRNIVNAQDLIS